MTRAKVTKISDKLAKINDSFTVNMYDNGFMVEVSGHNKDSEWASTKIIVSSLEELSVLIKEITEMERE